MYPLLDYRNRDPREMYTNPRRKVSVDLGDGDFVNMDWDKDTPPTPADVKDWMKQKRNLPATPPPDLTPSPTRKEPLQVNIQKALSGNQQIDTTTPDAWLPPVETPKSQIDMTDYNKPLPPPTLTPFHVMGATGAGTGRAFGSLIDKPGNVVDAAFEGGKGVANALSGQALTSPSQEVEKRTGKSMGGGANFLLDSILDVGNVVDPMNLASHLGTVGIAGVIGKNVAKHEGMQLAEKAAQKGLFETGEKVAEKGAQESLFDITKTATEKQGKLFPPEIQDAIYRARVAAVDKEAKKTGIVSKTLADMAKGNLSVIEDSGKTGPALARVIEKERLDSELLGSNWRTRVAEITKGLDKEQQAAYVTARDTGIVPNDPAVQEALTKQQELGREVNGRLRATGGEMRVGEKTAALSDNQWPRIYPEEFFQKNRETAITQMVGEGLTAEQANHAFDTAHGKGGRLIHPQTGEQLNVPGYRTDLEADNLHLHDAAERVIQAKAYGPDALNDQESTLNKLINGTNEPDRIREIVTRHLGKELSPTAQGALNRVIRGTMKVQTAMHLSHFGLNNLSQQAAIPLAGNIKEYTKALGKAIFDFKNAVGEADATGALASIKQDIMRDVGGESTISKLYGQKQSETFNRTVSALTGKGTAETLFKQLKKNPGNVLARKRLDNLLLEDIGQVMKQEKLTPEQLGRAGGRMTQITQGRADSIDLPKLWSDHPAAAIPTLFKKFSFRQTKIIADILKENPRRNIPLALGLYTAMGEVLGDANAGIKGMTSGKGPAQEIQDRGQGLPRLASNLGQSWAFGLFADLLESASRGKSSLIGSMVGPIGSDIGETAANVVTGNKRGLAKQALRAVPFVGTGLAQNEKLLPATKKKSGGSTRPLRRSTTR